MIQQVLPSHGGIHRWAPVACQQLEKDLTHSIKKYEGPSASLRHLLQKTPQPVAVPLLPWTSKVHAIWWQFVLLYSCTAAIGPSVSYTHLGSVRRSKVPLPSWPHGEVQGEQERKGRDVGDSSCSHWLMTPWVSFRIGGCRVPLFPVICRW